LTFISRFVYASSGQDIEYQDFVPGQPDNYKGKEHCAGFWPGVKGRWNDYQCQIATPFLCEWVPKKCPEPFEPLGNKCYFLSNVKLNFAYAKKACEQIGAKLAEPKSSKEMGYIKVRLAPYGDYIYLGLINLTLKEGNLRNRM
jgi:hypothetical protein